MTKFRSAVRPRFARRLSLAVLAVACIGLFVSATPSRALVGVHTLSIDDVTVVEGTGGTTTATFTVTLAPANVPSATAITVDYTTVNGTATAGSDYTATSGTLTFAPGDTTKPIAVTINPDAVAEPNEGFTVVLSNPTQATISDGSGAGTITDDELASLAISDATVTEGDTGTTPANFTVTMDVPRTSAVTVNYATQDATATQPSDYAASTGTVTFAPGETSKTITVNVVGDTFPEPNETFNVVLSAPSMNAQISDATGVGSITNDDGTTPSLAIGDTSVTEGNSGTVTAHFTVTRTNTPSTDLQPVTVNYATADGTATSGSGDYTSTNGTLLFAPGDTTKTVDVIVAGDMKNEADETFVVQLSNANNASISDNSGQGTILNDDAVPTLAIADLTAAEGSGSAVTPTPFTFTVSLSTASGRVVAVDYSTAYGTATASDFTATSGTVVFNEGDTSKTITVLVTPDYVNEANETFTVNLVNPSNATIADGQAVGTIANDDAAPVLSIGDATVLEGNAGTVAETFTVSINTASDQVVTASYATADNTAAQPGDYTTATGTITLNPGQTSTTVTVQVKGDTLDEVNETYFVNLTAPTNATLGDAQGAGTITDDDGPPALSIDSVSTSENAGMANFTVTLAPVSGATVTVAYSTVAGTATAGTDFTPKTGTLTFLAGESTKTISIPILQDTVNEADENYTVQLASPTGATIATATGTGTITDDDAAPTLSISDSTAVEGNAATTNSAFTITLSGPSTQSITVAYATADGTATAPLDYTSTSGTATFAPGETTKTVNVPIVGDTTPEFNETYSVNLSAPTNATISDAQGAGSITNDDGPPAAISVSDVTVTEGNTGTVNATFTVSLGAAATGPVTVHYATADGTATQPGDYATTSGDLTFAPGETSKTVDAAVAGDTVDEANESFVLNLTAPSANATINDAQGTATITDDDAAPSLAISDVTVTEGNTGTVTATMTVTLSAASAKTVTVHYATANGTAVQPGDYASKSGDLTFAPGETSKTIDVLVNGDTVDEANETFVVDLTAPTNATVADPQGTATITDDDGAATLAISDVTVTEGNTGTVNAVFTVTLATASGQAVTVHYATADGTAVQPGDYASKSGDLTFAPGETSKTVTVLVNGDTVDEPNETFVVDLTAPTNATVTDAQGQATITDDDGVATFAINDVTVTEGDTGTVNAVFTVTKTGSGTTPATVHYATADGTAVQPADYASTSGDLTFAPADTTKTITVVVNGDTAVEANETFVVDLTAPTNATVTDAQGVGTITTDDVAVGPQITTGAGAGGGPHVKTFAGPFNGGPTDVGGFFAYETEFAGGVRVARGDFDLDGKDEVVTASGPGRAPTIRVWSATGSLLTAFPAYASSFNGGVYVAVGDVVGDAHPEIITGAGAGGGPHVRIFDGGGNDLGGWFAYPSTFTGGVTVAAGNLGGAKNSIVTGAGAGGGPHVKVFDGAGAVQASFFAYDPTFTGGVYVAAGGLRVVTGAGAGGGPHVKTFTAAGAAVSGFFAYDQGFTGGVRVATANLDDAIGAEIITGPGPGGGPHIRTFGPDGGAIGGGFFAYDPTFTGGVYVAGGKG